MKKLVKICLWTVLLLAALTGGTLLYVQSPSGQVWLAHSAGKLLSDRDTTIVLENISGKVPTDMRVGHITLADAQGVYLELKNAHLAWNPAALVSRLWDVNVLEAEQVRIYRLPQSRASHNAEPFSLPHIPNIALSRFAVGELIFEDTANGIPQRYVLDGGGTQKDYRAVIRTLEGPRTALDMHFALINGNLTTSFIFDEESGGLLSHFIKLPHNPPLHATFTAVTRNRVVQVEDAEITAGSIALSGSGEYQFSNRILDASVKLHLPQVSDAGLPLKGAADATLVIKGEQDILNTEVTINSEHLSQGETAIADLLLEAALKIDTRKGETDDNFKVSAIVKNQPVSLDTAIHTNTSSLTVSQLKALYGPYGLEGSGDADFSKRQFHAQLKSNPIALAGMDGNLSASLNAEGSFEHAKTHTEITLASALANAHIVLADSVDTNPLHSQGTIDGNITRSGHVFTLSAKTQATPADILASDVLLSGDQAKVSGQIGYHLAQGNADSTLAFTAADLHPLGQLFGLDISGKSDGNIRIVPKGTRHIVEVNAEFENILLAGITIAKAALTVADEGQGKILLTLKALQGNGYKFPFTLQSPATITVSGNTANTDRLALNVAGGNVSMSGSISPQKLQTNIVLGAISLKELPFGTLPEGAVNATIRMLGSLAAPNIVLKGTADIRQSGYPIQIATQGTWQNNAITMHTEAMLSKAKLKVDTTLPVMLSLMPFKTTLAANSPLKGTATLLAPLDGFNAYLRDSWQHISGNLTGKATIAGIVSEPKITGDLALEKWQYDFQENSVCLRHLNATFTEDGKVLALKNIHATADEGGTLGGDASFTFADAATNGTLTFSQLHLLCGGLASGVIDGKLTLAGNSSSSRLSGGLTLAPISVQLPEASTKSVIPQVKTVHASGKNNTTTSQAQLPLALDIKLNSPNRLFVRGRGLDAEFSGNLDITGAATSPALEGKFQVLHGKFTLLDRVLKITNGNIVFDGPIPPSPFLDVQAQSTIKAIVVSAGLSGPASNPELVFSSQPSLPRDEILALLLFGRELSTLTPFQVVQLAQSTAELSGHGGGSGALGKIRSFLGIDTLDVGTDSNNDVTVGTGKYITDRVYVGVTQGAKPESRAVTTEVEVLPHVSADTSLGAGGQESVGVQWKYDY